MAGWCLQAALEFSEGANSCLQVLQVSFASGPGCTPSVIANDPAGHKVRLRAVGSVLPALRAQSWTTTFA